MKKTFKKSVLALALTVALGVSQLGMTALAYDEARLDTDTTFSGGGSHVMYIKNDGAAYGGGYTLYGTLGFEDRRNDQTVHIKLFDGVTDLSMGYWHSFIVKSDGTLWAMGQNEEGQLGNGKVSGSGVATLPVQVMSDVAAVVGQNDQTIALKTDGTLWRWGWIYKSVDGKVESTVTTTPEKVAEGVISASVSSSIVYYVKADGSLWSFGRNINGALGQGGLDLPEDHVYETTHMKILDDVVSVSGGSRHGVALKSDGTLWTWGEGKDGTLGLGADKTFTSTPTQVMEGVKSMATTYYSTYAIKEDGTLWAWGDNTYGQVGNGTTDDVFEPVKVMDDVVDVNGGYNTAYALKANGELWGWGNSDNYKLNAYFSDSAQSTPVLVATDVKVPSTRDVTLPTVTPEPTPEPTPPASDEPSDWAAEDVEAAEAIGIVPESLQGLYTQATTRAEFCALAVDLMETATGAPITERAEFSDTDDVNVQKMAGIGVVNGIGDGKFDPNGGLTREQAATILARLAAVMSMELTKSTATFSDNGDVSDWAFEAVGQMQASGIMGGVGENMFAPDGPYTREQSILTTLRVFNLYIG